MNEGMLLENSSSVITTKESHNGKCTSHYGKCTAVVESTGNMWIRIHDTLEENGIDTILANPYKTKIIAEAKIKSDKLDARILAVGGNFHGCFYLLCLEFFGKQILT